MEKFRVWITFTNGDTFMDKDWCGIDAVQSALTRCIKGPGRSFIKEVKVVDMHDCTVFLHRDGVTVWPEAA
jgi:hypothetical protein